MLLFYVDESGGTSAPRPGSSRLASSFTLAAAAIPDDARSSVAADFAAIKRRAFGELATTAPWGETEIKGRYLWQLNRRLEGGPAGDLPSAYDVIDSRQSFNLLLHSVERLFAKFRPVVFSVIVDKSMLASTAGADPLGVAYASLYQSVALTMEHVYGGASAAFVADQQTEHEKFFETGAMRTVMRARASQGKYRPNFDFILDKPLWIDSELSTWDREIIQLADLAAFTTRAWFADSGVPGARHFLWEALRPCLAADWRTGSSPRGAGLTIIPDPGSSFPEL
ncbi:DUF3800 domain-containing protein [Demequina sp. NBRC 110053]|uniref:DUF3800 domain-containing protein n=1 Tax=Demequina sp. NBRC 110053 TaxID=1570342 RepID=UPI000A00ABFE|nr:DUF3800 domain-containing protein [Demequina sp. NBRC 110053]